MKTNMNQLIYCMMGTNFRLLRSTRVQTKNTHGTGCTFSAVVTAELAKGLSVFEAVSKAKNFIQAAIEDQLRNWSRAWTNQSLGISKKK